MLYHILTPYTPNLTISHWYCKNHMSASRGIVYMYVGDLATDSWYVYSLQSFKPLSAIMSMQSAYRQAGVGGSASDWPFIVGKNASLVTFLHCFQVVLASKLRLWRSLTHSLLASLYTHTHTHQTISCNTKIEFHVFPIFSTKALWNISADDASVPYALL